MAMQRSGERILTTHVGSLVRPAPLVSFLRKRRSGASVEEAEHQAVLKAAVADVVAEQREAGIDIVSDGEFGKSISWSQYVLERISGFEQRPIAAGASNPFARGADRTKFAAFYAELDAQETFATTTDSVCVGPISYTGQTLLQRDIDNFKAALARSPATEAFMPVAAVSSVIPDRKNEFYSNEDDLLAALAEAMRVEYRMIVDAGFLLQLDDAHAAVTFDRMVPPASFEDYRRWLGKLVELINYTLEGIPEDRVRYHVCWGSWPGPHSTDVPLESIIDLILKVKAGAYAIEGANPRHEHEWKVWETVKLPDGRILAPGVVSHATNVVEHPNLVAERISRYVNVLGRENVIASTDCGFAQGPFLRRVHPSIQWAKLQALSQGAGLASKAAWLR